MRAGGASVRRTRYCLRAVDGRAILSRLPAIGHDLAPAFVEGLLVPKMLHEEEGKKKAEIEKKKKSESEKGKKNKS